MLTTVCPLLLRTISGSEYDGGSSSYKSSLRCQYHYGVVQQHREWWIYIGAEETSGGYNCHSPFWNHPGEHFLIFCLSWLECIFPGIFSPPLTNSSSSLWFVSLVQRPRRSDLKSITLHNQRVGKGGRSTLQKQTNVHLDRRKKGGEQGGATIRNSTLKSIKWLGTVIKHNK